MRRLRLVAAASLTLSACDAIPTAPDHTALLGYAAHNLSAPLVDTGPGAMTTLGYPSLFAIGSTTCSPQPACADSDQLLAGQFVLAQSAITESVEGWMQIGQPGDLSVVIRADASGLPGNTIYSRTYALGQGPIGWAQFRDFTTPLPAGTYWLAFEPVPNTNLHGAMPGDAPNPLPRYAFWGTNPNNRWVAIAPNPALGMRLLAGATPTERIQNLLEVVAGLGLPRGIQRSLQAQLEAVLRALDPGSEEAACGPLSAFARRVAALSGAQIPETVAAIITSDVNAILESLAC